MFTYGRTTALMAAPSHPAGLLHIEGRDISRSTGLFDQSATTSIDDSAREISGALEKHGASQSMIVRSTDPLKVSLAFRLSGLTIRLDVPTPENCRENERRRRWRVMVMVTKAKLEAIASGISTIEREFLSDIVMPDGRTVGETMTPVIRKAIAARGDGTSAAASRR